MNGLWIRKHTGLLIIGSSVTRYQRHVIMVFRVTQCVRDCVIVSIQTCSHPTIFSYIKFYGKHKTYLRCSPIFFSFCLFSIINHTNFNTDSDCQTGQLPPFSTKQQSISWICLMQTLTQEMEQ